jgi:hypothetical protein
MNELINTAVEEDGRTLTNPLLSETVIGNYRFRRYKLCTVKEDIRDPEKSWMWHNKPVSTPKRRNRVPKHGLTIERLVELGHKVRVKHLRYAVYRRLGYEGLPLKDIRYIVIPTSFRKDRDYMLMPFGGFTHISIKTPAGEYFCLSSECSPSDNFCYKDGVCEALNRLQPHEIAVLLEKLDNSGV